MLFLSHASKFFYSVPITHFQRHYSQFYLFDTVAPHFLIHKFTLVFCSCFNTVPQTWRLMTKETYFLPLEAKPKISTTELKSRCQQDHATSRGARGESVLAASISGGYQHTLAFGHITLPLWSYCLLEGQNSVCYKCILFSTSLCLFPLLVQIVL